MQKNLVNKVVESLECRSWRPLENQEKIKHYLVEASEQGRPLTLFDWECPPRALSVTNNGVVFVNYEVDLERVFRGELIDKYTELPRAISQRAEEIDALKHLKQSSVKFRFVKFIADTNAYYITPLSLKIIGRERLGAIFEDFKARLKTETKNYPVKVAVCKFTEVLKPFRALYNDAFKEALQILATNPNTLVESTTIEQQIERTREHLGIQDVKQATAIALRVIATYAAEGLVFKALSQTQTFSNCVWMNMRETDARTIAITNCLRKLHNQTPLPMWFPIKK